MEFQHILEVLLKRRRIFVTVFLAFFLTVVVVTVLSKPVYRATTKFLVEVGSDPQVAILGSIGLKTAGGLNTNTSTNTSSSGDYDTDVELARIKPLLEKVTNTLNLKARNGKPLKPERLIKLGFLRKTILPQPYINVAQFEDAQMVKIEAFSTNPEEALQMSSLLAQYYMEDRVARTKAEFGQAKKLVQGKIQDVLGGYSNQLAKTAEYKAQAGVIDVDKETSAVINNLYALLSSNVENERTIKEDERKIALDKEKIKELKPLRMDSQEFIQSDLIRYVQEKFGDFTISLAEKSVDLTKEHPDYKALEKKIDAVKDLVKSEINNGQKLNLNSERWDADPEYDDLYKKSITDYIEREAAIAKRSVYQKYIGDFKKMLMTYASKSKDMTGLDADTTVYKTTYQNLLGVLNELNVAEAIAMTNLNIVEPATLPDERYFPSSLLNYVAGFVLGLLFALGAVFFVDYADTTIRSAEDIRKTSGMPALGAIPVSPEIGAVRIISKLPSTSAEVEAFRALRNGIGFELGEKSVRSIAVTSLYGSEGKSIVASNLAIISSDETKRVLLADCNMLRPALHGLFAVENSRGITDVLAGTVDLKSAIRTTPIRNLDLLPCGPVPLNPGGAVESDKMKDILSELEKMYDLVVIEMPPIAIFSNTVMLGKMAGGILHVVEYGKVKFTDFERLHQLMGKAGLPVIGAVVNKEDSVTYATLLAEYAGKGRALLARAGISRNRTGSGKGK